MKTKILYIILTLLLVPVCLLGQTVKIGDILCTDGSTCSPEQFPSSGRTAEGVVFFVNENGQGWAVSLECQAVNTHWVTYEHYYDMYDIPELDNFEHSREAILDLDGYTNTAIIRNTHGADWYPAAWCVDFNNGWYLPAAGQLRWLMAYINEINTSLAIVNGTTFVFDNPRWYWTSTERTQAHAVVVSQTGSVANYPKYNYINEYEIGVRAVKSFTVQAQAPTIGEIVTTPSGQRGVVFYVDPDNGSYWLAAMNDLSSTYQWGLANDLPSLDNYNENDQYVTLHGVHCGLDATMVMREAMGTASQYASSHVDLEDGWHIPSAGQLSKLFAALPFIESALINSGGTSLNGNSYWTSTECSNQKAWTIRFDPSSHTSGIFIANDKTESFAVRPIWSPSCETPLPEPSLPDNIIETECNDNTPIPFESGELMYQTPDNVNVYATPLCGDIDGDGIVDIVIPHYTATDENFRIWSNQIDIYSGMDLSLQSTISIPEQVYLMYHPIGIVRYPLDNGLLQGAVVVLCNDGKLRSYSKTGQLLNTADIDPPCDGNIAFADFNGDGYPEVYIGNAIYDAATLKQLCVGPANGNKGLSYRGSPNTVYPHHANYAISYACNVLGDNGLELICGNTIYNVNIISRTNPSLNSVTVNKTVTPPAGYPQDGQVALADLDLDGETDIIVTKDLTDDCVDDDIYYYAYKPSTGEILFEHSFYCRGAGFPAICNIDQDPHPEILFVDYLRDVSEEKMHCLRYTMANGLSEVWSIHHNDPSGMTTMAFFDFNRDEIPEIVFRDSYDLNIINGSNGEILYSYPMRSGTAGEHPIVADVNNDGHAEIIVVGLLEDYYGNNGHGSLLMFGNSTWPDARKVWNQYAYNVTNVNNDLTIPQLCFNNATPFTAPDGTVRRPYNNFLQQAYYINQYGEPYNPGEIVEINIDGTGCNSFIFNDSTYTENGLYDQLIESPDGCDTIYHINVNLGEDTYHDFWRVHCYSYTWNDSTYTESGIYQQTFHLPEGCDSTAIMHLQILDTIRHEWSQTACNSYTWNGVTYTEPGDYVQHFEAEYGCDSISTLHLTFSDALEVDVDTTACDSYSWNGNLYIQSGIYDSLFVTSGGCDSLVHLHLTVEPSPEAVGAIEGPTEVYVSTDLILGQYFYSIEPVGFADHYEWTLENADWLMDTTGLNCALWVTTAGDATLRVKAWNGCGYTEREIHIHAGFYDIGEQAFPIALYPNPAHDEVFIEAEGIRHVKVYNMQGQCVIERNVDACDRLVLPLQGLGAGLYLIEAQTDLGLARVKLNISKL